MPLRDPGVFLEDIEHYAAAATRFTSGLSLEQYLADKNTRAAVERVLEVRGESMSNLYKVAPPLLSGSLTRATTSAFGTFPRMAMPNWTTTRSAGSRSCMHQNCRSPRGRL
jgi:hypothetical protein